MQWDSEHSKERCEKEATKNGTFLEKVNVLTPVCSLWGTGGYLATGKVKVESGWRRVLLTPRPRRATTVAQLSKNSTYIGACFAFGLAERKCLAKRLLLMQ